MLFSAHACIYGICTCVIPVNQSGFVYPGYGSVIVSMRVRPTMQLSVQRSGTNKNGTDKNAKRRDWDSITDASNKQYEDKVSAWFEGMGSFIHLQNYGYAIIL